MLLEVTRKRPIIIILLLIDLRKVVLISQMLITNTKLPDGSLGVGLRFCKIIRFQICVAMLSSSSTRDCRLNFDLAEIFPDINMSTSNSMTEQRLG